MPRQQQAKSPLEPKKPWTVPQLRAALNKDLKLCTTDLERSCCRAMCEREIRDLEQKILKGKQ